MIERVQALLEEVAEKPLWLYAVVAVGCLPLTFVVIADLDLESQAILGFMTMTILFILNKFSHRGVTLLLIVLSVVVSSRYLWWRMTNTLQFENFAEAFLGSGLFLAEVYAWIVLLLGFLQTAWPLNRKPIMLPEDERTWPTVDVYIPTYNESLAVVRNTVLGALSIDYPRDKFRVYILDDGKREEFRQFAEECGAGYITRPDNKHAKAGNLNHALQLTDGEYVAVFDSDHVPTRAFLQMSLGWFLVEERLALVQTPHHFYSPDPFERNLAGGYNIPNEGMLFYGLLQEGNDFWNAAFFCGSCAVSRRTALEAIGGFAVDTVTEDAHTALKLHRRGWETAYLRIPLAAGLATERLALHMGQRMRWARGMTQIFRIDNPLLGPGLNLAQRLCYLNAMLHFFFALPRFVFLTAPLAYLLFQQNIIAATALQILAYAGPHLVHSTVTNSRVQSKYRYSFWGEVYESVLAFYLLKPTLVTLINPRRGTFNVTEKGGLLPDSYFDYRIIRPQLILIAVLVFGVFIGVLRFMFESLTETDVQVLALNMAWATFNLMTLGVAVAVAKEARQIRSDVRMELHLPAVIYLPDGRTILSESRDLSMGGAMFQAQRPDDVEDDIMIDVELPTGAETVLVPARVVGWNGDKLRLRFELNTAADHRRLVRAIFSRADAWLHWDEHQIDKPLSSVATIFSSIKGLFVKPSFGGGNRAPQSGGPAGAMPQRRPSLLRMPRMPRMPRWPRRRRTSTASALLAALALSAFAAVGMPDPAKAQGSGSSNQLGAPLPSDAFPGMPRPTGQGVPRAVAPGSGFTVPSQPPAEPVFRGTVPGQSGVPGREAQTSPTAVSPPATPDRSGTGNLRSDGRTGSGETQATPRRQMPGAQELREGEAAQTATAAQRELIGTETPEIGPTRNDVLTLEDLGAVTPLRMQGVLDDETRAFTIRRDEVVTKALIRMNYAYSPALIPELSHLFVLLNDELIGSVQLVPELADGATVEFPVSPVLFQEDNRIQFRFIGHYTLGCEDPLHTTLWSLVSNTTAIEMTKDRLPLRNDLSLLPLPFFDRKDMNPLNLPFVFANRPSTGMIKAGGIVASWFGDLASYRGASFPASFGNVPPGNAVVFATQDQRPSGLTLPRIDGPTLAVAENPYNPFGRLLLVLGRTDEELLAAAQTLALGSNALSGPTATVGLPELPLRRPYDAPNWLPTDRPVRLGELVSPLELQGNGLYPGILSVNFQTAPGIFAWRDAGIPLNVRYRYPAGQWLDYQVSRLDILINNSYLRSLPLVADTTLTRLRETVSDDFTINEATVSVPPFLVYGRNQLQFFYDLKPFKKDECTGTIPDQIRSAIDPNTTIDFSNTLRYAPLPNLAFFANSGYPFTRMADLSDTAIVLPDDITPQTVQSFLEIMGLMGNATGYPVVRTEVVTSSQVQAVADKDLLVFGSFAKQPLIGEWSTQSPFRVEAGQLRVRMATPIERLYTILDRSDQEAERELADQLLMSTGEDLAGLISFESPLQSGRTVVMLTASEDAGIVKLAKSILSKELAPVVQGDLVVLKGNKLSSFRVGEQYTKESLPFWTRLRWYFADKPFVLLAFLLLGVVLVSIALFWLLRRLAALRLARGQQRAG